MARVKEGLKDIKTLDLLAKSRYIISEITKNFTPPPLLAQVIATTKALDEANNAAYGRGTYAIQIRDEKKEALIVLLQSLAGWVQAISGGSETMIMKSGFEIRKQNIRLGMPSAPQGVITILTKAPGVLLVRWKPVHGKRSYIVELNEVDVMDDGKWKLVQYSSKTKARLTGLESRKTYWVRIRTNSTRGVSLPSNEVIGMVW
ncbi:MAG: fibronectin type III domain-containing protein [Chitinophagales bacterium]|nr:fibronectin type III domain-containing protein [Chitinophagales bacterium]